MPDVEFSEEKAYNAAIEQHAATVAKEGGFVSAIPIKLGLAKDATGANIILAGIGIIAALLAVVIFVMAL